MKRKLITAEDFTKEQAKILKQKAIDATIKAHENCNKKLNSLIHEIKDEDMKAYAAEIVKEIIKFGESRIDRGDFRSVEEMKTNTEIFFKALAKEPVDVENVKKAAENYTTFLNKYGSKWRSAVNVVTTIIKYVALIISIALIVPPLLLMDAPDNTFKNFLRLDNFGSPISELTNQAKKLYETKVAFFNTQNDKSTLTSSPDINSIDGFLENTI